MACTIEEDFSKDEFLIAFISEEDEKKYQALVKHAQSNWGEICMEMAQRKVNGEADFSYYERQKKKLIYDFDTDLLPKSLCAVDVNNIYDFSKFFGQTYMVSQAFKDIIESVEPGVHDFIHFDLMDNMKNKIADYYYFSCKNLIDSINPNVGGLERRHVDFKDDYADYYYYGALPGNENNQVLFKDKLKGKACFYELHWDEEYIFITDEVYQKIQQAGLKPLRFGCKFKEQSMS